MTSLTQELTQTKSEMLASNDEEARSPELTLTKGKPDHERKHVDTDTYRARFYPVLAISQGTFCGTPVVLRAGFSSKEANEKNE